MNRVVRTATWAGLVLGVFALAGLRTAPAGDTTARGQSTGELIRDLGSPEFRTRERAAEELWNRGRAAIPALERAAADTNPEVARRAREVLDKFGWGIFPDTPPAVLKLIRQFQTGSVEDRKGAVYGLTRRGPAGRAALRAILRKDIPAETRDPIVAYLTTLLRREVPPLLFDGKADEAGELLALHTAGTTPEGVADYAAFQVLRDTVPTAIAAAEAARTADRDPAAANLVLAHLYRANRDWAKARRAADGFPRQPNGSTLVEMLLEEEGDWAALIDRPPPGPVNLPAALRLAHLRLAGRTEAFEEEARQVRTAAAEFGLREDVRDAAFSLLLNNRAVDAADLLLAQRQNLGLLSEILIARMRYKEALDLLAPGKGEAKAVGPQEKLEFDLRRARVLLIAGKRDEAVKLFTKVAEGLQGLPSDGRDWDDVPRARRALLRSELRVGLRDLACEHAALFVPDQGPVSPEAEAGETVFELLFGADADAAETLYRALRARQASDTPAGPTMRLVRALLGGFAPKDAVDEAVKILSQEGPGEHAGGRTELNTAGHRRKVNRLTALGAVCRGANRDVEAEAAYAAAAEAAADGPDLVGARAWVFGTSDAARPWLEYGEFLLDRGRFADAAAKLEAGWKRFPDQPLLLFLSGKALALAGDAKEGGRRKELAHWVGLGNERVRGKFLEELVRRGEAKAARRETDLLLRGCWSRDFYFGNVMNQAARAAALNKDWATAERCLQRSLLVLIKTPGVHFVDTAAYLNVPHDMLVFRTRGLLAAGKVGEAMVQARACLDVTPGHIELVSGMVPELDRLGRKAEANELFGRAWAAYRRVLADYPDSPAARAALASLGANCRRELDRALGYAKEAVEADPKSTGFRETLAEVHFRRGERDDALRVMAKLAEEHPRSRLYQRQLKRYRSGDLASPIPDTEDE